MEEQTTQAKGTAFIRRFPRRKLTTVVGVLSRGKYNIVPCLEIGEGGLQFQASEKHLKGGLVVANLFLPKAHFLAVTAEIVYIVQTDTSGRSCYGLRFKNLSFECKRQIRDYIAEKPAAEA
jgi:hypothetical protein